MDLISIYQNGQGKKLEPHQMEKQNKNESNRQFLEFTLTIQNLIC